MLTHPCRLARQNVVMTRSVTKMHAPIPAPMLKASRLAPDSKRRKRKRKNQDNYK